MVGSRVEEGRGGEPPEGESVGASESLDDDPQDPRLPGYPPIGPPNVPTDRLPDLYGSLSTRLGIKARRCPKSPARRISRDVNQEARDDTQSLMQTEAYAVSSGERKKIETLFGEVKRILALTRLRLRDLTGAKDEFLLTATVQNLKRLAKLAAIPPPQPITARSMTRTFNPIDRQRETVSARP